MYKQMIKAIILTSLAILIIAAPIQALAAADAVANNGGMAVKYKGSVYYREYQAGNFEKYAIFGDYSSNPETQKKMIRDTGGTKKAIFTDIGEGPIFILGDRMYLMKKLKAMYTDHIYSVDMEGKNKKEFGMGTIEAVDESENLLICTRHVNGKNELFTISSSGVEKKLAGDIDNFIALDEHVVYYTEKSSVSDDYVGEITLSKIGVLGTGKKALAKVKINADGISNGMLDIECFQIEEKTIYFSCGSRAGTGNFYQGGKIVKVNKDGTGLKILAGANDTAGNIFYVMRTSTEYQLYYEDYDTAKIYCLSLKNGTKKETAFEAHKLGEPFVDGSGVSVYLDNTGKKTALITSADYSNTGLDGIFASYDETYLEALDVEIVDGWVYYKLEAGKHRPEDDIGWRYCYERTGTHVYRKNLATGKRELLFKY